MASLQPIDRSFYNPSADLVAQSLLGHLIVRRARQRLIQGVIVEVEAYLPHDPASHSFRGMTARNRSMFGPPGRSYVYFIYGMHYCFNIVCQPKGVGAAVLLRAIEPIAHEDWIARRRHVTRRFNLTNGPAKVCDALGLDRRHDNLDLASSRSCVWIAHNPKRDQWVERHGGIVASPRIGISRSIDLPLRFYIKHCQFVSKHPRAVLT